MTVRPSILLVDDDNEVLRSLESDVKTQYSGDYRVLTAASGTDALALVERLALRGDPLALVVSDQRMPTMSGTELLEQVSERSPTAGRVLLTAYADTDAAIAAINDAGVAYYILKPWDPPEERLFPILDDLLEVWQAHYTVPGEVGMRVIGDRWSDRSHELRQFLTSNHAPFRWLEIGASAEAERLLAALTDPILPVVITAEGEAIPDASISTVAPLIGLTDRPESEYYDLVIVGAGPAGLASAVYGASEGLTTAIVESAAPGGQAGTSSRIENYLGFPQGVSGEDLARRAVTQARRLGASFVSPRNVVRLSRDDQYRMLELDDGSVLRSSAVIIATGVQYRELDAPGAGELRGRGVYYGSASVEAPVLAGANVVVVGGANSAGQGAVHLARFAKHVTMLIRGDDIGKRMSQYLVDQIANIDNISVRTETHVTHVDGSDRLERVG
ncbi:FAD-dependent oxidoreductase, partial [Ilumatobacter sp.]|uniref:FAD-dependent oxidoreductase n=1 Tax=Ilumatobacter sp. TaxID=1967498 RepID=UPI003C4E80CC